MKKIIACLSSLILATSLCVAPALAQNAQPARGESIYSMGVKYTAENDGARAYLEIARRSDALFRLLEENADGFVMDAYNYQSIDDEGTLLYTQNGLTLPVQMDPNGCCIRVSRNYFLFNPVELVDAAPLEQQMIWDDDVLNILVPAKYRESEEEIKEAYRSSFYFEKVEVDNSCREEMGQPPSDIAPEDLSVHVIYVRDGQEYFTYRPDLAARDGGIITDPVVVLYTGNIHESYAHSFMSQFAYFYSKAATPEAAYGQILPLIEQVGGQESFQKVNSVKERFGD